MDRQVDAEEKSEDLIRSDLKRIDQVQFVTWKLEKPEQKSVFHDAAAAARPIAAYVYNLCMCVYVSAIVNSV